MSKKLLKSGAIVSSMTLISRMLGLIRDVVVANLLGAGTAADVFFFANRIPNFLRRLFAEGAFAQAFIPVFTQYKQQEQEDELRELVARVSGTLGLIVTIVTLIGMIASPVVAMIFGTGWFIDWLHNGPDGHKFVLASLLLKITFPYLWFITFTGMAGAILNSFGRFAVASFTPVFLNVAMIVAAIYYAPHLAQPEVGLAWGVFFGGLLQFLFQLPFLLRLKMLRWPRWGWKHPGVTQIRKLMLPALFGVSVSQINLLFDTFMASFLVSGSISWLYYSDRLLEFPLGLFGIAIATVILPSLSERHVDKNPEEFARTMDWAVRMVGLLGIPAMAGMIILSTPMLRVLFMRGAFDASDVHHATYSLIAFSCGLLFFMLIKIFAPGFYARQDTRTPVRYGVIAMVTNIVLNGIFIVPFGYIGMAMATALSACLNACLLYRGLLKAGVYRISRYSWLFLARVALASIIMAAGLYYFLPSWNNWIHLTFIRSLYWLVGGIVAAIVVYGVSLVALGGRLSHLKSSSGAVSDE
ncbi:murein biosynthesis integral membrane protein MurJ [Celerinatantimonas sp. MCCC 1A17872]|uniref:murein biosynthesis integral membrane protein MurJ n=1 Tax=Celerinatantimonas sp. MCCC 1A17872 TaxID=3177514 RepID=UPI0038C059F9